MEELQYIQLDKIKNHAIPFQLEEITYLQGAHNYTIFSSHLGKQSVSSRTLKAYDQHLPSSFIRIHKSFIVNLHQVEGVDSETHTIHLNCGKSVPVSRRRWSSISEVIADSLKRE
ncbi:LytR/AlgR family response regulator transcription factor [Telluribacter humicola]|uniref:LytR/AlgR family response regulator transcription factor n=1 Tax=Telluribacter humicola TaxID=1720261 RepID=UPI001A967AF3|nr:LytTR family transcriptional regulator DNA-binding domain-containing protein [Telluribacter humicola]